MSDAAQARRLIGLLVLAMAVYVGAVDRLVDAMALAGHGRSTPGAWTRSYRFGADHPGWVTVWKVLCTRARPQHIPHRRRSVVIVVALRRAPAAARAVLGRSAWNSAAWSPKCSKVVARPSPSRRPRWSFAPSCVLPVGPRTRRRWRRCWRSRSIVLPLVRRSRLALGDREWCGVIVLVVGVGRVVLNVHHPSDVLAGWAAGYLWFAAVSSGADPTAGHGSGRNTGSAR